MIPKFNPETPDETWLEGIQQSGNLVVEFQACHGCEAPIAGVFEIEGKQMQLCPNCYANRMFEYLGYQDGDDMLSARHPVNPKNE